MMPTVFLMLQAFNKPQLQLEKCNAFILSPLLFCGFEKWAYPENTNTTHTCMHEHTHAAAAER